MHSDIYLHLDEESNRHTESRNFRRKDGQPDSVETEKQRQQKERRDLKQQRPQREIAAETAPLFSAVKKAEP